MRGVSAAALAATVTAATIIAAPITGDRGGPLGTAPGPPTGLAHLLAAAASAGLIVGAHALWRGSRRAAVIIAPALVGLGVAGVAEGRVLPSAVALAGAAALVAARNSFRLGGGRSGARPRSIILAAALAGAWGLAIVSVLTADRAGTFRAAVGIAGRWLWDGSWWLRSGAPPAVGLDVLVIAALIAATVLIIRLVRRSPRPAHAPPGSGLVVFAEPLGVSAVASAAHVLAFGPVGAAAWRLSAAQARLVGARA